MKRLFKWVFGLFGWRVAPSQMLQLKVNVDSSEALNSLKHLEKRLRELQGLAGEVLPGNKSTLISREALGTTCFIMATVDHWTLEAAGVRFEVSFVGEAARVYWGFTALNVVHRIEYCETMEQLDVLFFVNTKHHLDDCVNELRKGEEGE